jgi:hypothetical protein
MARRLMAEFQGSSEHQVSVHRFEASLFPVKAYLVETIAGA